MRGLVVTVLAVAAVACKGEPAPSQAAPAPAAAVTEPAAVPVVPGTLWFLTEGEPRRLERLAAGVRREVATDVFPTPCTLPDGRLVGIASRGDDANHREQLVLVGADGAVQPVGPEGAQIRDPAVDPQGQWIVVAANLDGHSELYRIALGTTAPATRITSNPEGNFHPVALGGEDIVFVSSRDGDSEIYRSTARGEHVQRLTAFYRDDWEPVPSPDRKTIAFLSDREGPPRLFLMNPDGTAQRRLTARPADDEREEAQAAWSPDGARLAYVLQAGARWHVWLRDVASGQERDLTPEGSADADPMFSPDGAWLVVSRTRARATQLWALPIGPGGAGEPVQLTRGRAAARVPRWR